MNESEHDDPLTLDPPGSIAVIGAGPLGIEAALYGRFLGYEVVLFESIAVGSSMRHRGDAALPILPDRCLSSLAISALAAQRSAAASVMETATSNAPATLPTTYRQWIDDALVPVTESDLLRNRLRLPGEVRRIATIPIEPDQDDDVVGDIPPDFELAYLDDQGQLAVHRTEAVIVATGDGDQIELGFAVPTDYFFQIGRNRAGSAEQALRLGHREIVAIYAGLAGRCELDLHRPRRV